MINLFSELNDERWQSHFLVVFAAACKEAELLGDHQPKASAGEGEGSRGPEGRCLLSCPAREEEQTLTAEAFCLSQVKNDVKPVSDSSSAFVLDVSIVFLLYS